MAFLPPPVRASWASTSVQKPANPTQDEYLTLLRNECRRRGLIDWNQELTDADIVAAYPLESYLKSQPLHHTDLTKEQWADPTDPINDFEFQEVDWEEQTLDQTRQMDRWNDERKIFLETYKPSFLQAITDSIKRDFLAAGGTQQRLDEIAEQHPANTILYWLAELWNLQERLNMDKDPKQERKLSIIVFSDISQEECHAVNCRIPYNETWPGFTSTMNKHLLVRYLVKKHNPAIAETLFVDDDTIWPPEGLLPLRNEDDSIVNPEQYIKRAGLVYDNGPGRGWWSFVHPKQDAEGLFDKCTDWKAINDTEDWDSLMKWLNEHREATAAFRHQSTKERIEFVAQKRAEEETVLGFPGYRPFNIYLDRHRNMVADQTQLYGPLKEDSEPWVVPEGSERMQSAAAQEIDAKLREWGIETVRIDEEDKGESVDEEEGRKGNDEDNSNGDDEDKSKISSSDVAKIPDDLENLKNVE
jgi:hypothetical protein